MEEGKRDTKVYPIEVSDYELLEEIGEGGTATVYRAMCIPFNEVVAIKSLDLEKCKNDLDVVRRETQTMCLTNHPNIMSVHCTFIVNQNLWFVMPYMAGGSCLNIMRAAHPNGLEEPLVATLLKETLKALEYLHFHGHIHRDIKAGNILVAENGNVKIGDFGVSACMFDMDRPERQLLRRCTFVGTPGWMAPEVLDPISGYDMRADIWSFGITALELAQGHAPFAKYPPLKVLQIQLQNPTPGLQYENDKRFSKSFRNMIAHCLCKDPLKRHTAEKLLKHPFFKNAKTSDYLVEHLLRGLPPLWERVRDLKIQDAAALAAKQPTESGECSHVESTFGWTFDVEDLEDIEEKEDEEDRRDEASPSYSSHDN